MDSKISTALLFALSKLQINLIPYAIIGSVGLALQGMDVKPNDIDILVNTNNLELIKKSFINYLKKGVEELNTTTGKKAWHLLLEFQGIQIEFLGEELSGLYMKNFVENNIDFVNLDGIDVCCLNLESQIKAYDATNRKTKADTIREFLIKNR